MKLASQLNLSEEDDKMQKGFSLRNIPVSFIKFLIDIHQDKSKGVRACIGLYVTIRNECLKNVKYVLSDEEYDILKNLLLGKKFNPEFATIEYIEQQMKIISDESTEPLLVKLKKLHPADLYFLIEDLMIN